MNLLCLLLCLFVAPASEIRRERVDKIELNTLYDIETGRVVFEQYLFWEYEEWSGFYVLIDWRLNKSGFQHHVRNGKHVIQWTEEGKLYEVESGFFYKTMTDFDMEIVIRDWLPKEKRRGLRR